MQVGVDVPLGKALAVSTGVARGKIIGATGGEIKNTGFGVAATYNLSKHTFVYTGFRAEKNQGAGSQQSKSDVFAACVRHSF